MKETRIRQTGARQVLAGVLGGAVCKIAIMGCYPLVPAYFAALYPENISGVLLMGMMYIGMLLFMPMTAAVKYGVALVVTAGAIRLLQWANESCPSYMAGMLAAITTVILSFGGSLLEWRDQPETAVILLEGVFVIGAVVFLNRFAHELLFAEKEPVAEVCVEQGNEERLLTYAETFQGLSRIFQAMSMGKESHTPEELGQVQSEVTGKVCASCESCAVCWEQETSPLYNVMAQLLNSIWQLGRPREAEKERLESYCSKSRDMVEEAVRVFQRINLNRAWYYRLLENRQVIAEQLDAMAYIMQDCAKEEKVLDGKEKRTLAEIRYLAKERGIVTEELHLVEMVDGRIRLSAALKSRMGGCIAVKSFLKAAERGLGRKLRVTADARTFIGREACSFLFYEDTRYRGVQGIARVKKDGAKISGDNFSFLEMERGELLLGLSDGMGSGSKACKESEMVLDLVERFLEAGFSMETAIRMMNSAMVLKGENDLYSTVDLCRINLYTGKMYSYKIGAAATFIRREGKVKILDSSNLPVGAEAAVEIQQQEEQLENGDFIVMVTDGVLEYLQVQKPEDTMCEIIESIETNNPGILSKRILERVMLFTGGKAKDDMTVLAACIWEKN
jgi:stage II sporulation protein E